MAFSPHRPKNRNDFRIAVICALSQEAEMVQSVFDKDWADEDVDFGQAEGDQNAYSTGVIGKHNIVLAYMPGMGSTSAAAVAAGLRSSYHRIEVAFVVGICGITPRHPITQKEIVLGDCIISTTIVQYDYGRQYPGLFERKQGVEDTLGRANRTIRAAIAKLQTAPNLKRLSSKLVNHLEALQQEIPHIDYPGCREDRLFEESYLHTHHNGTTCDKCIKDIGVCRKDCRVLKCEGSLVKRDRLREDTELQPEIHFGKYGSANTVMKSGEDRERLVKDEQVVAFEMEGAGVWDNLPTILVKSACDYADSHKDKKWQRYAAATAAAGLKSILEFWRVMDVERQEAPLRCMYNVPDLAVAHFVHRNDILEELDTWLSATGHERMVLMGMGGAGKSQLALRCCKMAEQHYKTVLWIDASSLLSVKQSYKIIVSELDRQHDAADNVDATQKALQARQGRWLLVFDNFDSPTEFRNDPITNYIPNVDGGKVLFTSRDMDSERLGQCIMVSGMTEYESLELLLGQIPADPSEREDGLEAARELGNLALALDQAQAYIRVRQLSPKDFIKHLKKRKKAVLETIPDHWEYRKRDLAGQREILLSAFTTWELSFEQMSGSADAKRKKEHFLSLCAFFDSSISSDYFMSYCGRRDNDWTTIFQTEDNWDRFLFDDIAAECRKLSLLQSSEDNKHAMSFHPLIRDWLKLRMIEKTYEGMVREFTDFISCRAADVDFDKLSLFERQHLLSNVFSCLRTDVRIADLRKHGETSLLKAVDRFAWILYDSGYYTEARTIIQDEVAVRRDRFGRTHVETLRSMQTLALIYQKTEQFVESEELYAEILAAHRAQFGPKHQSTLRTMQNLALLYQRDCRYDEAEELFKEALAGRTEELGPKHHGTLGTMQNLAIVYRKTGRFDEAEKLYKQALAGLEEQLGREHPYSLRIIQNLGLVYQDQGRYSEAEEMLTQALIGRQKRLGTRHPSTLHTMSNLAIVYRRQGRYKEAEELSNEAMS